MVGVLPNQLVLVALQFVAPGEDELRAHVLNVGRLEIIQLHGAVGAVIDAERIVRRKLDLL